MLPRMSQTIDIDFSSMLSALDVNLLIVFIKVCDVGGVLQLLGELHSVASVEGIEIHFYKHQPSD